MFKSLTQLYSLVVCLFASITVMITIGLMLNYTTDLLLTTYKFKSNLANFSSNEKYVSYKSRSSYRDEDKQMFEKINAEDLRSLRLIEKEDYIDSKKSDAISNLIEASSWLLTGLLFFVIHWQLYKRSTKANNL